MGISQGARAPFFYAGVFLISAVLMALQILLSRIFSVTTWYHLAFLVISVAMFGMTLAALDVYRRDEEAMRARHAQEMAAGCRSMGWAILVALIVQLTVPIVYDSLAGTLLSLPIVSVFAVMPFFWAGRVLSLALTRAPYPVPVTYGLDLLGAAGGCLFALALMHTVDAPSAVLVLAALALACSALFGRAGGGEAQEGPPASKTFGVAAVLFIFALVNTALPQKILYPFIVKGHYLPQSLLSHDEWNSISRVTVSQEHKDTEPFFWGPSDRTPAGLKASYYGLTIDGDAGTPINRFDGDLRSLDYLGYDVTTLAYSLPGLERGAIIGVGGGRDALTALHYGLKDITALDINNVQISLLKEREPFKSYAGLHDRPEIHLINSEARSWFAQNREAFDIIQMSLIDTWAATGAGAFALSENGLYTVDAWKVFLSDLKEGGVLTVSRWHAQSGENEMQRMLAMAVETLLQAGASDPAQHIFVAKGGRIATLVLSKAPFSSARLSALRERVRARGFETLVDPGRTADGLAGAIVSARSHDELMRAVASDVYDLSPPSDIRPFFFNMVRLSNPGNVFRLVMGGETGSFLGHAKASMNLFVILAFALVMVGFVILWPLRRALGQIPPVIACAGTGWFLLIGLGFMLFEISLLQRMSVFLGHPVYSLGVVMFSLIFSTGAGSLLSGRFALRSPLAVALWALAAGGLIAALPCVLGHAFGVFAEGTLPIRALLCTLITCPAGLLLGYGFPTGMALVQARGAAAMPWFWGINGAAGVLGSVVAVALNIALGLDVTMILAGVCYGLLIVPSWGLRNRAD
jgi:predicted membrane-bound spermidine synthase